MAEKSSHQPRGCWTSWSDVNQLEAWGQCEVPINDEKLTLRTVVRIASVTVSDSRSNSDLKRISAARERIQSGTTRVPVPSRVDDECGIRNDLLGSSAESSPYRSFNSVANRESASIGWLPVESMSMVSSVVRGNDLAGATVHPSVNTLSTTRSVRCPAVGCAPC